MSMALLLEADSSSDEESLHLLSNPAVYRDVSSASDCGSCFGTDSIAEFTSSDTEVELHHSFAQVAQTDVGTIVL